MTFDRWVAGAIEAFEFLRGHLRTDKVLLLAESMGTLTAGSMVKRRPDRAVDLGPGTQTWPGRSEPPADAEPGPQAALPARGARSYRSDKADRLVGV
jgi:pimeloyl-ACP methyl ester carboxylesterase